MADLRKPVAQSDDAKLDLVMVLLQNLENQLNLQTQFIKSELSDLKESTEMSRRALRGHNGDLGLVGAVARLTDRVSNNEAAFCDLSAKVEKALLASSAKSESSPKELEEKLEKKVKEATDDDHVVRWSTVRDKLLWPVLIAVVMAILYLISSHNLFPKP